MEIGSPEWIQASLEKLEQLEQERDNHENALDTANDADSLRMHSVAIDQLDDQIKSLYADLESVAEEEDDAEEDDDDASHGGAAVQTTEFTREPVQSARVEAAVEAPPLQASMQAPQVQAAVEAPPVQAPAIAGDPEVDDTPFGRAPASSLSQPPPPSTFGDGSTSFDAPADDHYDYDPPKTGGAGKWIGIIAVVAVIGGGGLFFANKSASTAEIAPLPTGPVRVIKAGAVPEDTEEPSYVKGGNADTTPTMDFSKAKKPANRSSGNKGRKRANRKSRGRKKANKESGHSISIAGGNDPI